MISFVYFILCLVWGSTWIGIKIGLEDAPPITTVAIRFFLAITVILIIAAFRKAKFPRNLKKIFRIGYPGLFMYGVSYLCVYHAQQWIHSSLAAVLFATFPFFVAFFSQYILKSESLNMKGWIGLTAGFVGVLIISVDSLVTSGQIFVGTLLSVAAPFVSAYGIVIHKRDNKDEDIVIVAAIQMMFGVILLTVGMLLFEDFTTFHWSNTTVYSILYLALAGTVLTFLGYYWLLKRIRVVTASMIAFITPVVAILIGVLYAGESLSAAIFIGTGLILTGVFAVARNG